PPTGSVWEPFTPRSAGFSTGCDRNSPGCGVNRSTFRVRNLPAAHTVVKIPAPRFGDEHMTRVMTCPSVEQFQQLLEGRLIPAEAESMAEHIEQCSDCPRTIAGLNDDTLVSALRSAARLPADPHQRRIAELIERCRRSTDFSVQQGT